ncbi:MAG TPA: GNAT family N-acetyltransferase [Gaiellaceae bacterium]|nr:GNAT family N-acetyltransferase [Gaiellaceae bacterium]
MESTLIELAEEPGLWIPPDPSHDVIVGDGYSMVVSTTYASVERIRLDVADVPTAFETVRAIGRQHGVGRITWWVGDRSTPGELAARLIELGLEPDPNTPTLTSLTIDREPGGEPAMEGVTVRHVTSAADYLRAMEINWEVWDVPAGERQDRRRAKNAAWPALADSDRSRHYLAELDGEPVGFARAIFTPHGALLMGGAVLPAARGHGVYTALVHARWRDAVAFGAPRIVVSAGHMSAPILERLGFTRIGGVKLFVDRLA